MRILLSGATGFVGRALIPALQRQGHRVVAWVRSPARARHSLGAEVQLLGMTDDDRTLATALAEVDAVINLAGERIAGRRWTHARKARLRSSRVDLTARLVRAMAAAAVPPRVFISASAVGYYGSRGDEVLTETSTGGTDFLAALCRDWEAAAEPVREQGVRLVLLRLGVVLGREGGMLEPLLPVFSLGLGGPIGRGRHYLSWIHLHDLVRVITTALTDTRYDGVLNAVAPEPVTNRAFTASFAAALRRPAVLPVPTPALSLALGESARVLTDSQRVVPARLSALGFKWEYATVGAALAAVTTSRNIRIFPAREQPVPAGALDRAYVLARPATYLLQATTTVDAPLEETFEFFASARNLGLITPASMQFEIADPPGEMHDDVRIDYRLKMGPVPLRWRTRISKWVPLKRFVDIQERGPYRCWWHEHVFRADGTRTVMEDRVWYTPPFGLLGRVANRLFIEATLLRIFGYRADVIRMRFGDGDDQ